MLVIHNNPQDITGENLEETVLAQNFKLGVKTRDFTARFKFRTKRGLISTANEAGQRQGKASPEKNLKIG